MSTNNENSSKIDSIDERLARVEELVINLSDLILVQDKIIKLLMVGVGFLFTHDPAVDQQIDTAFTGNFFTFTLKDFLERSGHASDDTFENRSLGYIKYLLEQMGNAFSFQRNYTAEDRREREIRDREQRNRDLDQFITEQERKNQEIVNFIQNQEHIDQGLMLNINQMVESFKEKLREVSESQNNQTG